jgi:hypothetical protein
MSHDLLQLQLTISSLAEDAKESSVNVFSAKVTEVAAECGKNQKLKALLHHRLRDLLSPQSMVKNTGVIRYRLMLSSHSKDSLLRAITTAALMIPVSAGRTPRIPLLIARSRATIQEALVKPVLV